MKKIQRVILPAVLGCFLCTGQAFAGNDQRAGQAGASELLINPWARSSGWAGADIAGSKGLESMYLNVAGTAFTQKTELLFSYTNWLGGSQININSFGFSQRVGETGALSLGIMSMNFGNIPITTENNPDGGLGTYSPSYMNLGLSYAKGFSENIYGGMTIRVISENLPNLSAKGVALDAGIQYVTGKKNNIHFGISLKNVGPRMQFSGDGLSFRGTVPSTGTNLTVEQRSAPFEMPSQMNIGGRYDFLMLKDSSAKVNQRVSVAGAFVSNSFQKDQFLLGVEYSFKGYLMLRAGYAYENGIFGSITDTRTTAFTGPTGGVTFEVPFGTDKKSTFALDYSYRATNPFSGCHSLGIRMNL
ncbi:MAG: PorV/PorQ family protein [Bacteroidia bacterium]